MENYKKLLKISLKITVIYCGFTIFFLKPQLLTVGFHKGELM